MINCEMKKWIIAGFNEPAEVIWLDRYPVAAPQPPRLINGDWTLHKQGCSR